MRRWLLVIMLVLTAGTGAYAGPEEGSRDWLGQPPICC